MQEGTPPRRSFTPPKPSFWVPSTPLSTRESEHRPARTLSPSEQRQIAREDQREAEQFAALSESTGAPSEVGRWTRAPFQIRHVAANAATLPTGEVMFWGPSFSNEPRNRGNAALWDPSKGYGSDAFTEIPPPPIDPDGPGPQETDAAPIFCSGLSMLASGEVLVAGGNLVMSGQYTDDPYTTYAGLNRVFTSTPGRESGPNSPR